MAAPYLALELELRFVALALLYALLHDAEPPLAGSSDSSPSEFERLQLRQLVEAHAGDEKLEAAVDGLAFNLLLSKPTDEFTRC